MVNLKVFLLPTYRTSSPSPPQPTASLFSELFCQVLKTIELLPWVPNKSLFLSPELNKNRRKLFEPPNTRTSFLEGGASGRLPRQYHSDIASVSGRWQQYPPGTCPPTLSSRMQKICERPSLHTVLSILGVSYQDQSILFTPELCAKKEEKREDVLMSAYQMPHVDYFFFPNGNWTEFAIWGQGFIFSFYLPI